MVKRAIVLLNNRRRNSLVDKIVTKYENKSIILVHTKTTSLTTIVKIQDFWRPRALVVSTVKLLSCAIQISNMAHNRFLARTVLVGEGSVNQALRALQRVLTDDKIIKDVQLKRNYEKPTVKRRRLKYESSLKLYNSEMKKKVEFLMSKQRKVSPWT